MKIGFTGTRHGMTQEQTDAVERLLSTLHPHEVHYGDCVGADHDFFLIIQENYWNMKKVAHPCDIKSLRAFTEADEIRPKLPPLERNRNIVDACEHLIVTPGSFQEEQRSGTWATVRYARKSGVPITIVWPDGQIDG